MKAKKVVVKVGKTEYEYSSRSAAALDLLEQRKEKKNNYSKAEIARLVGMTSQTVHAVQKNAGLKIDFSNSPRGRNAGEKKPATKSQKGGKKPSTVSRKRTTKKK